MTTWIKWVGCAGVLGIVCLLGPLAARGEDGVQPGIGKEETGTWAVHWLREPLPNERRESVHVNAMAETPDGSVIAWGNNYGSVFLYDFGSNQVSAVVDRDGKEDCSVTMAIDSIAFDRDGSVLLWFDFQGKVWSAELDGTRIIRIRKRTVARACSTVESNLLPWAVVSCEAGPGLVSFLLGRGPVYLRLKEARAGGVAHDSPDVFPGQRGGNKYVRHAAGSPDKKLLMAVGDGDAALLSLPDMKILRRFGRGWGECAAFSPSSKRVALGTDGRGVFVYNTADETAPMHVGLEEWDRVSSMVFTSERTLLAAAGEIFRMDLSTGEKDIMVKLTECNSDKLLLSQSQRRLFVGSHDGGVGYIDLPESERSGEAAASQPAERQLP